MPSARHPVLTSSAPFADYPSAIGWDECRADDGSWRGPWQKLANDFTNLGTAGIAARWTDGQRELRENGVTYSILGDAGSDRPWMLDGVPALISRDEWQALEPGLIQRAHLLEQIIADCYGQRQLIQDGHLPAATVFGHPGFLRPCHNVTPPGGYYLHLMAIDLLRAPDGQWLVSNHRCQAPSGFGYALENRVVVSRTFPSIYHAARVERLAGFFADLLRHLRSLAPRHQDQPRIVLLGASGGHTTSFENAYLARYLNLPVVRGQDLTVRDDGVYLKTIGGLAPVDVILRRVPDHSCDPLALDSDGSDGTAGLLHAARRGQVAVINGFGCSVGENGAWMPRLYNLCQHLRNEKLLIPSVDTLWAGTHLTEIEAELDNFIIKPAFVVNKRSPVYVKDLNEEQREQLVATLRDRPLDFIAQRDLTPSTTPTWTDQGFRPRPLVLRSYLVRCGDDFRVMPGGLARVAANDKHTTYAMQRGALAKDLWIVGEQPVRPVSMLPTQHEPLTLRRSATDIPSRIADDLFWLGRYAERAENTARMLRLWVIQRSSEDELQTADLIEHILLKLRPAVNNNPARLLELLTNNTLMDSIPRLLSDLQRTALAARDRLSDDTWRLANRMVDALPTSSINDPLPVLNRIIIQLGAFAGMALENSVRGPGWTFMELGRRIERADYMCVAVPTAINHNSSPSALLSMLEQHDSIITYRSRYLTVVQLPAAIDLLVTDGSNPRSLAFQASELVDLVGQLPQAPGLALPDATRRIVARLDCELRLADPYHLTSLDGDTGLSEFLTECSQALAQLSDELTSVYLSHTAPSRNLGRSRPTVGG